MQEDDFLQDYKQAWQQDNEAMERLVDIPLETLHENIARYERQKTYPGLTSTPLKRGRNSRRIVWMTVSAAACLAFAVGTGLRYMSSESASDGQVLVAENRMEQPDTYPATTWRPSQEGTAAAQGKNDHTSHKTNRNVTTIYSSTEDEIIAATSTPAIEEAMPADAQPNTEEPDLHIIPVIDANAIETTRLVAMGETTAPVIEIETEGLVKITTPSRNTFHEAIVEPLLALVTYDM